MACIAREHVGTLQMYYELGKGQDTSSTLALLVGYGFTLNWKPLPETLSINISWILFE